MPGLAVIQAEGSAPFYEMFRSKRATLSPVDNPVTLATAIRIGKPVSWKKALSAIEWTNGVVESVSEQEIADAKAMLGADGIGCEPASAATLAGIRRLVQSGGMDKTSKVVGVLLGILLKDPTHTFVYQR